MSNKGVIQYPEFTRIVDLQYFIVHFAKVLRVPHLGDLDRPENDVEHSYGLAITCWYLAPKIAPELDLSKILMHALAHDTVELYAGDTFVFGDKSAIDSKPERERQAIIKLREEWPDFPAIASIAEEYMQKTSEEARFVYAVDKLLPVIMINIGEKDAFWHRHKITLTMQANEKRDKVRASTHIAPYYEKLLAWMSDPNYFYPETATS